MRHHISNIITSCIALQALIRGRVHTVRGKGKSCFMVLRQGSATVQVEHTTHNLILSDWLCKGRKSGTDRSKASQGVHHCTLTMAGRAQLARALKFHLCSADTALTKLQAILFVDDKTVSKGMVKYATNLPRESIVDVSGEVHVPDAPVAGCTCSKVRLFP